VGDWTLEAEGMGLYWDGYVLSFFVEFEGRRRGGGE